MTICDYLARCIALNYQTGIGMIGAVLTAAATLILCADLSAEKDAPERVQARKPGEVIIQTWAGEIRVEGAADVFAPTVDAIRTSNAIEASQEDRARKDGRIKRPDEYDLCF